MTTFSVRACAGEPTVRADLRSPGLAVNVSAGEPTVRADLRTPDRENSRPDDDRWNQISDLAQEGWFKLLEVSDSILQTIDAWGLWVRHAAINSHNSGLAASVRCRTQFAVSDPLADQQAHDGSHRTDGV